MSKLSSKIRAQNVSNTPRNCIQNSLFEFLAMDISNLMKLCSGKIRNSKYVTKNGCNRHSTVWLLLLAIFSLQYVTVSGARPCDLAASNNIQMTHMRVQKMDAQSLYLIDVPETTPVNQPIFIVKFVGAQTAITLSTSTSNPYYRFNTTTREIILSQSIILPKSGASPLKNALILKIDCSDASSQRPVTITISLIVKDMNNWPPVFTNSKYSVSLDESKVPGDEIIIVQATDIDQQDTLRYSILPSTYSDYFEIKSPAQGRITLKKRLDYEQFKTTTITIQAKDTQGAAQTHHTATALLSITIIDHDDKNPVFLLAPYTGQTNENAKLGDVVTTDQPIIAVDGDTSLGAAIEYRLIDPAGQGYFTIANKTNGTVTVKITGFKSGVYFLMVEAYQPNNKARFSRESLTIYITAANVNAPVFSENRYQVELSENVPVNTFLIKVNAIDPDKATLLTYSIAKSSPYSSFRIDHKTGKIYTTRAIDYELTKSYNLTIQASDGQFTDTCGVEIAVIDQNDNSPIFDPAAVYAFGAQRQPGFEIGKIQVTDADANSKFNFQVATFAEIFQVNSAGILSVVAEEDKILRDTYTVLVTITDNGAPPLSSSRTIDVTFPQLVAPPAEVTAKEIDYLPLIVVACIAALFLFIIICLVVYICKSRNQTRSKKSKNNSDGRLMFCPSANGSTVTLQDAEGATTLQQNPLVIDNNSYYMFGHDGTNNHYDSDRHISEIQIDTAITPTSMSSTNGSVPSLTSSNGDLPRGVSTFKDSLGRNNNDHDDPKKRIKWDHQRKVEVFNAENAIEPGNNTRSNSNGNKPGITVYF